MSASLKQFTGIYFGLTAVFLLSIILGLPWLHYATKPLFMVVLMVYHYQQLPGTKSFFTKMVQFGLFFSWIGDIALMVDEFMPILFVVGLGAFLIAHIGYSLAFLRNVKDSGAALNVSKSLGLALPFALFTGCFFYYVKDSIPAELFVPVLAYTVVISIMGITSALRHGHVDAKTFNWVLIGAILFILSDCVIAINKLVLNLEYNYQLSILNMILYLTGQFMITVGAVYNFPNPSKGGAPDRVSS